MGLPDVAQEGAGHLRGAAGRHRAAPRRAVAGAGPRRARDPALDQVLLGFSDLSRPLWYFYPKAVWQGPIAASEK